MKVIKTEIRFSRKSGFNIPSNNASVPFLWLVQQSETGFPQMMYLP